MNYDCDFYPINTSLLTMPPTSEIVSSISLPEYHRICFWHLYQARSFTVPTNMPIRLGAICYISGLEYQDSLEFAFAPDLDVHDSGWQTEDPIIEGYWPAYALSKGLSPYSHSTLQDNIRGRNLDSRE